MSIPSRSPMLASSALRKSRSSSGLKRSCVIGGRTHEMQGRRTSYSQLFQFRPLAPRLCSRQFPVMPLTGDVGNSAVD